MLRTYRRRRLQGAPDHYPLEAIASYVGRGGRLAGDEVRHLASELGLPAAGVYGALTFYSHFDPGNNKPQTCRGVSCRLAGTDTTGATRGPACLGYCYASPVAMSAAGTVIGRAEQVPPAPPVRALVERPIVTRRLQHGSHSEFAQARQAGVYQMLFQVVQHPRDEIIDALANTGLRGRGGAGYDVARKWRACADAAGGDKVVIANGDEGDPGSFVDRMLMEHDPHAVIEGLAIAGLAVRAHRGIVFVRSEYPRALDSMRRAVDAARQEGVIGGHLCNSNYSFEIDVVSGMGSYVCGEETALLNAVEGVRGEVRVRPPYPADVGLYGHPTVVNNVETLVNVAPALALGASAYRELGTKTCPGTKVISLNHGFAQPGLLEIPFGTTVRQVIEAAGGCAEGELAAVILGGPMGALLFPEDWDAPLLYGGDPDAPQLGHGGTVAVPAPLDDAALLTHWLAFMESESCGKCVPCALGSRRAAEWVRLDPLAHADELHVMFDAMEQGSLCAFGELVPGPMRTLLRRLQSQAAADNGADHG